jgi:hypothetical protein
MNNHAHVHPQIVEIHIYYSLVLKVLSSYSAPSVAMKCSIRLAVIFARVFAVLAFSYACEN